MNRLIFEKIAKKLKFRSHDPQGKIFKRFRRNLPKTMFFQSCNLIFDFFGPFIKNAPEYINPFGNFVFYGILCSFTVMMFSRFYC